MLKQYIHLFFFTTFLAFSSILFAQKTEVKDAGKFGGSINGEDFQNMIRYGKSDKNFTIATGNENFTLTINWQGVSSPSDIIIGTINLPVKDNSVAVLYLDNKMGMPFIIGSGTLTVTENNGKVLKGTLEFTAAGGGIPKEMGGTETIFSNGKFEIDLTK